MQVTYISKKTSRNDITHPGAAMRTNSFVAASKSLHQCIADAATMRSAQPSGAPVRSNVPSTRVTRVSETVSAKTARMPSLGSTQRISEMDDAHSGWLSRLRVKMPVPEPSLLSLGLSAVRWSTGEK